MLKMDLDEKLKLADFTFGFELEAIWSNTGSAPVKGDLITVDKDLAATRIKKLEPRLQLMKQFGGGYHHDASIKAYDPKDTPFEYVSGVLQFTNQNILRFTQMLLTVQEKGVYTNESCGLHIHFGFPDTTRKQLLWIKTVYLFDKLAQDNFEYFQSSNGPIAFWSQKYASVGDKNKLKARLAALVQSYKKNPGSPVVTKRIAEFFADPYFSGKYTVLGIHEKYRTLEWRGPRGFLATGQMKDVVSFVKTLRKFVQWLSNAEDVSRITLNAKTGLFIRREDFFNMIENHAPQSISHFAVDAADAIDKAKTDAQRAQLAYDFFKNMDYSHAYATNYRKVANRIKFRYPKAYDMFQRMVSKNSTIPDKIKRFLGAAQRAVGIRRYNESAPDMYRFSEYNDYGLL